MRVITQLDRINVHILLLVGPIGIAVHLHVAYCVLRIYTTSVHEVTNLPVFVLEIQFIHRIDKTVKPRVRVTESSPSQRT